MDCLPQQNDFHSYIKSCLHLLANWSWLYEYRNVDLLGSGILDSSIAPFLKLISELQLEDFNLVPQGFIKVIFI